MHQTFYIDVDEEITSIIERIRKAHMDELVIVIPKGALLIQSIINLKLLKKEADNSGKEIIIVTQDKIGKLLVEKAGIAAEQRLEDIEGEVWEEASNGKKIVKDDSSYVSDEPSKLAKKDSGDRLDKIGSSDFFESKEVEEAKNEYTSSLASKKESSLKPRGNRILDVSEEDEKILNKELVIDLGNDIKKNKNISGERTRLASMDLIRSTNIKQKKEEESFVENKKLDSNNKMAAKSTSERAGAVFNENKQKKISHEELIKNEKFEQFLDSSKIFSNQLQTPKYEEKKYSTSSQRVILPSKFWKFFIVLSLLVGIFALGLFLYLFLPKAKVSIFLKTKSQSMDAEIKGDIKNVLVDVSNRAIPAKLVSFADEVSQSFESTGEKTASSRKARGTITIYNEYSKSPQTLVATTRFLSTDGKLFRLVSNVIIPGMSADSKPGAIEAEVVADEAGDSFNIEATTFSIPGFQSSGSEKYSKFYAKSFKSMSGGGSGDAIESAITEQDIDLAKKKIAIDFNNSVKQKIKNQSGGSYVILDDAISISENNYKFSNSIGDIAKEFTVTLSAKIEAIVFDDSDLKDIMEKIMNENSKDNLKISGGTLKIDFGKSDLNLSDGTILIRVHGNGMTQSSIDLENLKKGILGKNNEDLKAYLSTYAEFSNVEVEYWPSFISEKIPIYESRTEVVLDNN